MKQIKIEEIDQKADQNKKISKNLCVPVYLIKFTSFNYFKPERNLGTEKPLMKTWLLLELLFNTFND